jgi:hypothetical protein
MGFAKWLGAFAMDDLSGVLIVAGKKNWQKIFQCAG